MDNQTPQQWATELRDALSVDGEVVPFERVLKRHLTGLEALRKRGLTWPSLANVLKKNGVLRPDGRFYSADHLRVSYDRLTKVTHPAAGAPELRADFELGSQPDQRPRRRQTQPGAQSPAKMNPVEQSATRSVEKDVSADEIALIAARLNRSNK